MNKEKGLILLFTVLSSFVGLIFIAISIGIYNVRRQVKLECTRETIAEIIDISRERVGHGHDAMGEKAAYSYFPVYQYHTDSGQVTVKSHYGGYKKDFVIGSKVIIYYDPSNIKRFYRPDDSSDLCVKIFSLVGAGLLISSAVFSLILIKFL